MTSVDTVLLLVNAERTRAGLPVLIHNADLASAALAGAAFEAADGRAEHRDPEGRLSRAGYRWQSWGEVAAEGQTSAAAVVAAWMASPGHRRELLGNFTEAGFAVLNPRGVPFWMGDLAVPAGGVVVPKSDQWVVMSGCQGWGSGMTAKKDANGAGRQARAMKAALGDRYKVGIGITPAFGFTNPDPLDRICDAIAAEGVGVWIDVFSSDVRNMLRPDSLVARATLGTAFDPSHGVGIPRAQIERIAKRLGSRFAGCRGHEVGTQWRTDACLKNGSLDWDAPFADYVAGDAFCNHKRIELGAVKWLHETGRKYLWSEPLWARNEHLWPGSPPPDDGWFDTYAAKKFETWLTWQCGRYPGTILVGFANNVGASAAGRQYDYWNDLPKPPGVAGWFLGDQSWLWSPDGHGSPDIDGQVGGWAAHALRSGAAGVWVEPPWLFFNWPGFSFGPTPDPPAADSGAALPEFAEFCAALP